MKRYTPPWLYGFQPKMFVYEYPPAYDGCQSMEDYLAKWYAHELLSFRLISAIGLGRTIFPVDFPDYILTAMAIRKEEDWKGLELRIESEEESVMVLIECCYDEKFNPDSVKATGDAYVAQRGCDRYLTIHASDWEPQFIGYDFHLRVLDGGAGDYISEYSKEKQ